MKFENTEVWGFKHALRGMRNPLESWDKADSYHGALSFDTDPECGVAEKWAKKDEKGLNKNVFLGALTWLLSNGTRLEDGESENMKISYIGPADMKCAQKLIKAGPEHRKFLRQIFVSVDITAPLYIWKEFDTYKIGTTANSTSTMHKLCSKPITIDCFEISDIQLQHGGKYFIECLIPELERLRLQYLFYMNQAKTAENTETAKEFQDIAKGYWKELVRWLPNGWLQTRTVTMSYENLYTIYHQRKNHKLKEWSQDFMEWIHTLPYADSFITLEEDFCAIVENALDKK